MRHSRPRRGLASDAVALRRLFALIALAVFIGGCARDAELEWTREDGYRWAELAPGGGGGPGFQAMRASRTNIHFQNHLSDEHIAENRNLLNGSGVAAGDVDGDGLVDLYFAQLDGPNRLYRNRGSFEFEDVTDEAGVAHTGYNSTGVVFADVDGDDDLDLLVTSLGERNVLYVNDGNGRFAIAEDSGLGASHGSSTMALADVDGDGDLDLYVANYKEKSAQDLFEFTEIAWENTVRQEDGRYVVVPPFDEHFVVIAGRHGPDRRELGTRDELYLNQGDGTFDRVENPEEHFLDRDGEAMGLEREFGLTARFHDLNGDGHPDLYVCNDFWTPDRVWLNQGDGTFTEAATHAMRTFSFSSMAVDFSDVDRDGYVDFFVSEMLSEDHETRLRQVVSYSPFVREAGERDAQPQYMRNTLYANRGDGTFAEVAHFAGVEASGWSWATQFLDVDLDGYEDLLINTGHAYDVLDIDTQERLAQVMAREGRERKGYVLEYPPHHLRNVAYRNHGDWTFTDASADWGFDTEDVSHGMAVADLDNDGDLDVAVNRLNDIAGVFRNRATAARIVVRLKGRSPNTGGVGAKIRLTGGPVDQQKEITSGGGYLSGSDLAVVFAASDGSSDHVLTVTWPSGAVRVIDSVRSNRIYEVEEPAGGELQQADTTRGAPTPDRAIFEDLSEHLNHHHRQADFNDFTVQRLLPVRISRSGPGVAWMDLDGDGDDELLVGAGQGDRPGAFENVGGGRLEPADFGPISTTADANQTAIVGWQEGGEVSLLVGQSSFGSSDSIAAARHFSLRNGDVEEERPLPASTDATGAIAAADYDGDGNIDVFVGGRLLPGQYPADPTSRLFKGQDDVWRLDAENADVLSRIGMVTDAVFVDYDGDGDQDLVCTTAWGPVQVLSNTNGRFSNVTGEVGLDAYYGWWHGVAVGDFNNDGRPDLVATNLGTNSAYQRHLGRPIRLYFGDFGGVRGSDILEAYFDPDVGGYVPRRGLYELHAAMPTIIANVTSHRQFAQSTVEEILGRDEAVLSFKSINTLEHTVLLNTDGGFEARPLPMKAQWSTAFYAGVADFDNDGNEDLFITQNLFSVPPLTPRLDAGRGLWLRGSGTGDFEAVSGDVSGIKMYGEQRGAALGDFDEDGRVDLVVTQNGGDTKLYRNSSAGRGVRVRLRGPTNNASAIGSSVRVVYANGERGPRRFVQSGSGYLSQNSLTQVLGARTALASLDVTWFDGTTQVVQVSGDEDLVEIEHPGTSEQ